jgi:hypothetical protein
MLVAVIVPMVMIVPVVMIMMVVVVMPVVVIMPMIVCVILRMVCADDRHDRSGGTCRGRRGVIRSRWRRGHIPEGGGRTEASGRVTVSMIGHGFLEA